VATRSGGPRNTLAFASLLKKKLNSLSRSAIFSPAVGGLQPEGSLGCSVFSSVHRISHLWQLPNGVGSGDHV
jgi:hypothetical protein